MGNTNEINNVYTTFNDAFLFSVVENPKKTAFIQLDNTGEELSSITYKKLYNNSITVARILSSKFKKGERCLIAVSPGIEFVIAFFGCLLSGIIAVPVSLPGKNKKNLRFWSIIKDAEPECIITDNKNEGLIWDLLKSSGNIDKEPEILIVEHQNTENFICETPDTKPSDIAFIQYTSGSLSTPKGVLVSHKNILHNSELIKESFNHTPDLIVASWLPQFHDMGLIGCVLQPLYVGGACVLMKPVDFIKNPALWFESISKYKATTVGCPNFALDYCVEKIQFPDPETMNLSSLKVMFCGSEPVRKTSIQKFSDAFSMLNFKPNMFLPCYGLAEATLMVSGIHQTSLPEFYSKEGINVKLNEENSAYTSCGTTWNNTELVVVNPDTFVEAKEGEIGEIWVKNDSVCNGYWNNTELTEETFKATTFEGKGPFLRTGDLGFIRNSNLCVTGRIKDMIIVRGENYFPSDIESVINNCHPALVANKCAAFSVNGNSAERLVIVQEIKRTYIDYPDKDEIYKSIISSVSDNFEVPISSIELIKPMSTPTTTSGKIKRLECRDMFVNETLKSVSKWKNNFEVAKIEENGVKEEYSEEEMKTWIRNWLANKLNMNPENIDSSQPVLSYGLDSIGAVELECDMNLEFDSNVFIGDFLENNSIDFLVKASIESKN